MFTITYIFYRYVKILQKITYCMKVLKYFSSRSWAMKATNTRRLLNSLNEMDKREFPCDPMDIKWDEYLPIYFNGIRKYLLKIE